MRRQVNTPILPSGCTRVTHCREGHTREGYNGQMLGSTTLQLSSSSYSQLLSSSLTLRTTPFRRLRRLRRLRTRSAVSSALGRSAVRAHQAQPLTPVDHPPQRRRLVHSLVFSAFCERSKSKRCRLCRLCRLCRRCRRRCGDQVHLNLTSHTGIEPPPPACHCAGVALELRWSGTLHSISQNTPPVPILTPDCLAAITPPLLPFSLAFASSEGTAMSARSSSCIMSCARISTRTARQRGSVR